jgi:hypothetical protein
MVVKESSYKSYFITEIEKRLSEWLEKEHNDDFSSVSGWNIRRKILDLDLAQMINLCENEKIDIRYKTNNIWQNIWYS